jgi:hypothetical protein
MAGLVPAIHVEPTENPSEAQVAVETAWMTGTSPAMTAWYDGVGEEAPQIGGNLRRARPTDDPGLSRQTAEIASARCAFAASPGTYDDTP